MPVTQWVRDLRKRKWWKKDRKQDLKVDHLQHRPSLTATAPSLNATSKSKLFNYLPPEIRRLILIEAFGQNFIHIDPGLSLPRHAPLRRLRRTSKFVDKRELATSITRFAGVVCPETGERRDARIYRDEMRSDNSDDGSNSHRRVEWKYCCNCCHRYTDIQHFLNPLGWLLSCRRAYVEGIEVLYCTNQFQFPDVRGLPHLSRELGFTRLATVTAVELCWPCWPGDLAAEASGIRQLGDVRTLFETVPRLMPALRSCYLNIQLIVLVAQLEGTWLSGLELDVHATMSEWMLKRIDEMVIRLKWMIDFRVAFPLAWYYRRRKKLDGYYVPVWHEIADDDMSKNDDEAGQRIRGYWIYPERMDVLPTEMPSNEDPGSEGVFG